jgi:DHA1 family bicyclomycin/chloramphenicol resistance-like MFS transporter
MLAITATGIGGWLGWAMDGTVWPLAWGLAFWSLLTCAAAWMLVQRHAR